MTFDLRGKTKIIRFAGNLQVIRVSTQMMCLFICHEQTDRAFQIQIQVLTKLLIKIL